MNCVNSLGSMLGLNQKNGKRASVIQRSQKEPARKCRVFYFMSMSSPEIAIQKRHRIE